MDDLKHSKSDQGEGMGVCAGGRGRGKRGRVNSLHDEPVGCLGTPPPPSQIQFLAHNATQSRGVTKNVVLVGTIIMLVASVRRMFC